MKNRALEFRIYPNRAQEQLLAKTFGCVRLVYNHYLDRKKQLWQESLRHLDTACQNFFQRKESRYPRFKSRKRGRQTYTTMNVNHNIRIENGRIRLPKVGEVKIRQHRQVSEGWNLKSVTVKKAPSGKYFVSILFEYESQVAEREIRDVLGLDFSMPDLYVTSEGERCGYPKYFRQAEQRLARAQRKLSRMQKGSANYAKQKVKVAKIHEKIANQRKDFLHKRSYEIAEKYDAVSIEDLDMQGMSKSLHLGKSVHDDGWGMFTRMLEYKLADRGGKLVKIDRWYPSSQMCSGCGHIVPEVKDLRVRVWFCDWCLEYHDRDENAAANIREEGRRLLGMEQKKTA